MRKHNIFYRIFAVLFAASLLINAFSSPIFAEKTISDLESELSGLNEQSQTLSGELSSIIEQLDSLNKQLAETREALATAKGQEAAQYKAMKNRIKYMYENNSTTLLDSIFASRSMAEFLSRITFVTSISEYDQNAMQKLIDTRKDIAKQEAFLKDTKASLASLQQTLIAKEAELQSRIDLTKKDLAVCRAQIEQANEKLNDASSSVEDPVPPSYPEEEEKPPTSQKDPVEDVSVSDVELLAALIECEAGSSNYEGMLAVGSVVVNRMKSHYYPNTLRGVIYQSGQFPPATNGLVDNVLKRGIKDSCKKAAEDALAGKNNVGDCLSFRAASSGHAGTIIGDNVFF